VSKDSTKMDSDDYDLQDEYDLSTMMVMPKGRYAPGRKAGKNLVVLDPDIAVAFPDDESVNQALRLILTLSRIPQPATP
jgi:hypothetical protein